MSSTLIKERFDVLANTILSKSKGKKIVYIANPGNFGDGLIRYATKAFFSDYKIEHEEVFIGLNRPWFHLLPYLLSDKLNKQNYVFIYGGGGAWAEKYDFGYDVAKFISRWSAELIVLPSTFGRNVESIKGELFYRDNFESKKNCPNGEFCHDMAFYLTTINQERIPHVSRTSVNNGYLFRTDAEARLGAEAKLPSDNIDISTFGDAFSNVDEFLRYVSNYNTVYTDRLHVAIAGIVLNKQVELFTGNYFKIKRIFESSIDGYFLNVNLNNDEVSISDLK